MNELANPLELCGFEFIEFVAEDGNLGLEIYGIYLIVSLEKFFHIQFQSF